MIKVAKFGGSSVAQAAQFAKVKAIMEQDPARRVAVISAAGKRDSKDHKMTDLLYLVHAHLKYGVSPAELLKEIRDRLLEIRDGLGISYAIEADFDAFAAGLSKESSQDEIVSRGEYFTSKLMAAYLGFHFLDAADCIFFNFEGNFDREKTDKAIGDALAAYGRLVIPGFYGAMPDGKIRVMTRGGSDITGAVAAAALNADVYENWTDVSGILMADPRIVKDPKPIERITYAELHELAYMGASVLHEDAIQPVKDKGILLNIRNTNRPEDQGTLIMESFPEEEETDRPITGISGRRHYRIITLFKRQMEGNEELRHALKVMERNNLRVDNITLGLGSFALVVSFGEQENRLYDILAELKDVCQPDSLDIKENIALVAAVGRQMSARPGTSGRLFRALGENGVNIRTIAQGADELSIIVGVEDAMFETAIRVLYDNFGG